MLRLCLQRAGQASASAAASCSPSVPALGSVARMLPAATCRPFSSEPEKEEREITNPVVLELVDRIVQLNLMEVSDLTELLRKRLNLPASVGMPMMAAAVPAAAAAPAAAEAPKEEKTSFDIKLDGFDAAAKIKVIKEIRAVTDLGLKEAKELVEGAPVVVKKGLKKEEAEELQKKLEAVGAKITLE